jgi:hypothetical protein
VVPPDKSSSVRRHRHDIIIVRFGVLGLVRTSQETHYFSDTESNQLMLCKI